MRALSFVGIAIIVVLLAVIGLAVFRPASLSHASANLLEKVKAELTGSPQRPSPTTPPKPPDGIKRAAQAKEPVPAKVPEAAPPARLASAQTSYPFPLESEIATGTPESAVQETFGPPQAIVRGSDFGRLNERFLYIDKATGKKTLIFLLDGKVIGAQTYIQ